MLLVKARGFAMETLIFVGLIVSGLILFLLMSIPQNTKLADKDKQLFSPTTKVRSIYSADKELKMNDNGGTRFGTDRRKFKYTAYIPEKRSGRDRRKGFDRRSSITRRRGAERRSILTNRESYPVERRDVFRKQS
jgi:hypothetical protein